MPGVLTSNSHSGFSRQVGKMAFVMPPDLMTLSNDVTNETEISDHILESSYQFLMSENIADFGESDSDLPDNELPMDLIKYLDSQDQDVGPRLHRIKCEVDCNSCTSSPTKYGRYRVSERLDPFMGMGAAAGKSGNPNTILGHIMSPIDYDSDRDELMRQKVGDTKTFIAWNTPKIEEPDYIEDTSSIEWPSLFGIHDQEEESSQDVAFPDTPSPSTQSETVPGDDSDVDIETVTDAPRSDELLGYDIHESSPRPNSLTSSAIHKLKSGSLFTILSKSVATNGRISSAHSSASLTSRDVSKTVNQASNHSDVGQKRKLSKERKFPPRTQTQSSYHHALSSSTSVNFHDYAMSPGACTYSSSSSPSSSTETGMPTVMSKRIYKRKHFTLDTSDKEKQHHHNQLERNRRQKLADLFVDLRDEVPKIASQSKASKVLILNEATLYIRDLQRRDRQQEDDISKEIRRKDMLRNQLRSLEAQMSGRSGK